MDRAGSRRPAGPDLPSRHPRWPGAALVIPAPRLPGKITSPVPPCPWSGMAQSDPLAPGNPNAYTEPEMHFIETSVKSPLLGAHFGGVHSYLLPHDKRLTRRRSPLSAWGPRFSRRLQDSLFHVPLSCGSHTGPSPARSCHTWQRLHIPHVLGHAEQTGNATELQNPLTCLTRALTFNS